MSTIKTKNVQVGTDGTASNNFTIYVPGTPDGTVRIGNGDAGAVTDAVTINSSGAVTLANNLTVTGTVTQTGGATFNGGITGNVAFDTDTLYVDATNNRVGIGTSSPLTELNVHGGIGAASTTEATTKANALFSLSSGSTGTRLYQGIQGYAFVWLQAQNSDDSRKIIGLQPSGGNVWFGSNSVNSTNGGTIFNNSSDFPNSYWQNYVTSTGTKNHFTFNNPNGEVGRITTNGTATAYNTSSDYRLKENITPMSGGINRLKLLKPCTWTWKIDGTNGQGFVAHEVQEVIPESVTGIKDGMRTEEYEVTPAVMKTREVPDYQGIDQSKLVPLLTAALQEAITKIEDLETRIQALESNP